MKEREPTAQDHLARSRLAQERMRRSGMAVARHLRAAAEAMRKQEERRTRFGRRP